MVQYKGHKIAMGQKGVTFYLTGITRTPLQALGRDMASLPERQRLADDAEITTDMLIEGRALRDTDVDDAALKVMRETGLNEFQRHIGTLEGVDTVTIHVLKHLGAGDGLDLQQPPEVRKYAAKLIGLDVLPTQAEPGPMTIDGDGAIMQPRALVQALIRQ